MSDSRAILLYDGSCGFCSAFVQFIFEHEKARHFLRFAPLAGATAAALRTRNPRLATLDTVIWYEPAAGARPERVLIRSDAALAVAGYLGAGWRLLGTLGRAVPRMIRDGVYDAIARRRHRISRGAACALPTAEQRSRFIDEDL